VWPVRLARSFLNLLPTELQSFGLDIHTTQAPEVKRHVISTTAHTERRDTS